MGRHEESRYPMEEVSWARDAVVQAARSLRKAFGATRAPDTVDVAASCDRRAALPIHARLAMPPYRASVMDGYAVHHEDTSSTCTVELKVAAECFAGAAQTQCPALERGTAAYVVTGAPVPEGATAVVKIEWTYRKRDGYVFVERAVDKGQWIREIGIDVEVGEEVLPQGTLMGPAEIGLAVSVGCYTIEVERRPRVGVLSTGNELVDASCEPGPGQIRDSNRLMLLSAVEEAGGEPVDLGIVIDDRMECERRIMAALEQVDLLITTGGVSMGAADFVKPTLESNGSVVFGRLNMKPGKPTVFATVKVGYDKLVLALPGNPASSMVVFQLLAVPAISALLGDADVEPVQVIATTTQPMQMDPDRPEYHRVLLRWSAQINEFEAFSTGNQMSSRLLSLKGANGLLVIPQKSGIIPAGSRLPCLVIGSLLGPTSPRPTVNTLVTVPSSSCGHHQNKIALTKSHLEDARCILKVAILTCSDRAYRGEYEDRSGPAASSFLKDKSVHKVPQTTFNVVEMKIVPDDFDQICSELTRICDSSAHPDVIFTSGGTGFSKRDVTPEATRAVIDRETPGLSMKMLIDAVPTVPTAILSRAVTGIRKQTLIINLVGSTNGVVENLRSVASVLPHACAIIRE